VHSEYIDAKYYPNQSCERCHEVTRWQENHFDHNLTNFELAGAHANQACMACHGVDDINHSNRYENFRNLSMDCAACHDDVHRQQFAQNGVTYCLECHSYESWGLVHFDHNKTAFKLDGEHANADCGSCHIEVEEAGVSFVFYKIKNFECIDCHQ
jgi:nitrate/TMAO reductase-like tetraheme cytochrome c subunit